MSESSQASSPSSFFNLHVEGVGYLNRVRTVNPKKGQEFLACTVAALRGSDSDVSYTKFDCRVSGADAQAIVKRLEDDVAAEKAVIIGFNTRADANAGRDSAAAAAESMEEQAGQLVRTVAVFNTGTLMAADSRGTNLRALWRAQLALCAAAMAIALPLFAWLFARAVDACMDGRGYTMK